MKQPSFSWIRNPMTIIALFVALTEAAMAVALPRVPSTLQATFTWFIMLFPTACLMGFFAVLLVCPHRLYGPSDFRSDESYVALNKRVVDVQEYAKLIDQKIQSMPFYQFARLSECATRVFLGLYYEGTGRAGRPASEALGELRNKFPAPDVERAEDDLISIGWATRSGKSIAPTQEGREAHRVLAQFVYARVG